MRGLILFMALGWATIALSMGAETKDRAGKAPFDLTAVVEQPGFWDLDKAGLAGALKGGPFRWTSEAKSEIRGADYPLVYHGLDALEVVFRFKAEKLSEVYLSLYNRGDAGDIDDEKFTGLIKKSEAVLDEWVGATGEEADGAGGNPKYHNVQKVWLSSKAGARMATAYSKLFDAKEGHMEERSEFINLTLFPGGLTRDDLLVHRQGDIVLTDFDKRVIHQDNGDVLIPDVPMVDQGQKGYCAVATMERILRYYGCEVNEHELAQQANSSGDGGTDPRSLAKALKMMSGSLGLRFTEFHHYESDDFFAFIDGYNQAAKRLHEDPVHMQMTGSMISIPETFHAMNVDVLKEYRLRDTKHVDAFLDYIRTMIDQGWPVAWSVQLGWVQETPSLKNEYGGHMRLIIGYNPDTREILYSDSWGHGHELKRMSLNDAYMISQNMYVIEPRL